MIVLIIFGAGKLPEIGAGLGKGISNFRRSSQEAKEIDVTPGQDKDKGETADKSGEETGGDASA